MGARFRSVLGAGAAIPAPATTVTGPDAYGAAAVVGTGTSYARSDHDHGLPAAPSPALSSLSGTISANTGLTAATPTSLFSTASLAIGTWLLSVQADIANGGATAGVCELWIVSGTVVATYGGPTAAEGELPALTGGEIMLHITTIVTVTTAGTVTVRAQSAVAANALLNGSYAVAQPVTGYTAIKIA